MPKLTGDGATSTSGNVSQKHQLNYILGGLELVYAEPEDASPENGASSLMQNLI